MAKDDIEKKNNIIEATLNKNKIKQKIIERVTILLLSRGVKPQNGSEWVHKKSIQI